MRSCSIFAMLALSFLAACDDSVVVELQTGPQPFELEAGSLALPSQLRDDSGDAPRIATVSCDATGDCPSTESAPITCERGVCDPSPMTLSAPLGEVVDLDVLAADASGLLRRVDAIEVLEARYEIGSNTISIDLPAIEISWGPEGATEVDPSMGVVALGMVPAIGARTSSPGTVVLDPVGVAALSDHLVGTSRRVRLFARARIDLAPGDEYPSGRLQASVDLRVRITGSLVR